MAKVSAPALWFFINIMVHDTLFPITGSVNCKNKSFRPKSMRFQGWNQRLSNSRSSFPDPERQTSPPSPLTHRAQSQTQQQSSQQQQRRRQHEGPAAAIPPPAVRPCDSAPRRKRRTPLGALRAGGQRWRLPGGGHAAGRLVAATRRQQRQQQRRQQQQQRHRGRGRREEGKEEEEASQGVCGGGLHRLRD